MKKSRSKTRRQNGVTPNATSRTSDEPLIKECMAYSVALGAYSGAFACEPGGNVDRAPKVGERYRLRAKAALEAVTSLPALTYLGLEAKARVALRLLEEDIGEDMEKSWKAFFLSFAADAKKITGELEAEHWRQQRAAANGTGVASVSG